MYTYMYADYTVPQKKSSHGGFFEVPMPWLPFFSNCVGYLRLPAVGATELVGEYEMIKDTRPGKHPKNYVKIHHFSWGNPLFLWVIFYSYVSLPEGNYGY